MPLETEDGVCETHSSLMLTQLVIVDDAHFLAIDKFDFLPPYFGEKRSCQTVFSRHNTSLLRNDVMRPDCTYLIAS